MANLVAHRQYTDLFIIPVQNCILNHMRMYRQCVREKTATIAANIRTMMEKSMAMIASGLSAIASVQAIDTRDLMRPIAVSPVCSTGKHPFGVKEHQPYTNMFFEGGAKFDACNDWCQSTAMLKEHILAVFKQQPVEKESEYRIQCCHEHHFMVESMNELVVRERMSYRLFGEAPPVYLYVLKNRRHIPKT